MTEVSLFHFFPVTFSLLHTIGDGEHEKGHEEKRKLWMAVSFAADAISVRFHRVRALSIATDSECDVMRAERIPYSKPEPYKLSPAKPCQVLCV